MFISIIITTYNRKEKIVSSINSSIEWSKRFNDIAHEIIVIDDASTDGTFEKLRNHKYFKNKIKLFKLEKNIGVSGAKNYGAKKSTGKWITFLDSDDTIIYEKATEVIETLIKFKNSHIIFFRCQDKHNFSLIGPYIKKIKEISYSHFIEFGTQGECLPFLKREIFLKYPYDQDLRGCEGISYARMLKYGSKVFISPLIVRNYDQSENDLRLSTRKNSLKRGRNLMNGHIRMLKEFYQVMTLSTIFGKFLRIIYYFFMSKD